jgi:hypothetical protein
VLSFFVELSPLGLGLVVIQLELDAVVAGQGFGVDLRDDSVGDGGYFL